MADRYFLSSADDCSPDVVLRESFTLDVPYDSLSNGCSHEDSGLQCGLDHRRLRLRVFSADGASQFDGKVVLGITFPFLRLRLRRETWSCYAAWCAVTSPTQQLAL